MDGLSTTLLPDKVFVSTLVMEALRGWRILVVGSAAGAMAVLIGLWIVPPEYTAHMVVGPVARSGAAAMGPHLPALVGSAGRSITEPGAGDEVLSDYRRFIQLLGSVPVAGRLAESPGVMPGIFAPSWDSAAGAWRPSPAPLSRAKRLLLRGTGRTPWAPPDARDLADHLRSHLRVAELHGGPMLRLSYRHRDRDLALGVLAGLHRAADRVLREEAARRVEADLAYLRARLADTTLMEHRKALVAQLAERDRLRMMIDVDLPFAADIIEPASTTSLPDWPNPVLLLLVGIFVGTAGALFWIFARLAIDRARR